MKNYENMTVTNSSNRKDCFLQEIIDAFGLSETQAVQFRKYRDLLIEWNKKFNLTAIVEPDQIARYHFYDSIEISRHFDFLSIKMVADIGTGAGFPAIPLKILFPHLSMVLIEVNSKKRTFLEYVAQQLGLQNIVYCGDDWRTFLRTTDYPIECFLARASLSLKEMVRIFKPSLLYNKSLLIYWASQSWLPEKQEEPFLEKEVIYQLDAQVQRKYAFFRIKQKGTLL